MVDENAFHATRHEIHQTPCPFKKAIFSTECGCEHAERLYLGDRELINCAQAAAQQRCQQLLAELRAAARFTLQLNEKMNAGLPHDKQIRVETGGIQGLAAVLNGCPQEQAPGQHIDNINALIEQAMAHYGSLNAFPYSQIVRTVAAYNPKKRRRSKRAQRQLQGKTNTLDNPNKTTT